MSIIRTAFTCVAAASAVVGVARVMGATVVSSKCDEKRHEIFELVNAANTQNGGLDKDALVCKIAEWVQIMSIHNLCDQLSIGLVFRGVLHTDWYNSDMDKLEARLFSKAESLVSSVNKALQGAYTVTVTRSDVGDYVINACEVNHNTTDAE